VAHLEEIKARSRATADEGTRLALAELRAEVQALRETTTRFDISFAAALNRLEERVKRVETRVPSSRNSRAAAPPSPPLPPPTNPLR